MLHYDFGLICESAIIDQQTNYLSIIKVLEGFNFSQLPAGLPKLYLVTSWSKTSNYTQEQKSDIRLKFLAVDSNENTEVPESQFEIVVPSDKKRLRALIEVGGLPISQVGEHRIIVEQKNGARWTEAGYISFDVSNNVLPQNATKLPID